MAMLRIPKRVYEASKAVNYRFHLHVGDHRSSDITASGLRSSDVGAFCEQRWATRDGESWGNVKLLFG
jgi:hypothetical protein